MAGKFWSEVVITDWLIFMYLKRHLYGVPTGAQVLRSDGVHDIIDSPALFVCWFFCAIY